MIIMNCGCIMQPQFLKYTDMKILLALMLLTFFSCKQVLKITYGFRQPRIETNRTLQRFTASAGIRDTLLLHIDSASSWHNEQYIAEINRMPALEFYSPEGVLTGKLNNDECTNIEGKIKSIVFEAQDTSTKRLSDVLQKFEAADGRKITMRDLQGSQAIVCIYYTNAFGKASKEALSLWPDYLKKHDKYPGMKFIYLNIDMHESWGIQSKNDDRYMIFEY